MLPQKNNDISEPLRTDSARYAEAQADEQRLIELFRRLSPYEQQWLLD